MTRPSARLVGLIFSVLRARHGRDVVTMPNSRSVRVVIGDQTFEVRIRERTRRTARAACDDRYSNLAARSSSSASVTPRRVRP